eukprot:m51a1_g2290 hypothetical protein (101) ;mRNA; r:411953-412255
MIRDSTHWGLPGHVYFFTTYPGGEVEVEVEATCRMTDAIWSCVNFAGCTNQSVIKWMCSTVNAVQRCMFPAPGCGWDCPSALETCISTTMTGKIVSFKVA